MPTATRTRASAPSTAVLLRTLIREVKLLRSQMANFLPEEDLEGYEHPDRIKRSYQEAIKRYPPMEGVWR